MERKAELSSSSLFVLSSSVPDGIKRRGLVKSRLNDWIKSKTRDIACELAPGPDLSVSLWEAGLQVAVMSLIGLCGVKLCSLCAGGKHKNPCELPEKDRERAFMRKCVWRTDSKDMYDKPHMKLFISPLHCKNHFLTQTCLLLHISKNS